MTTNSNVENHDGSTTPTRRDPGGETLIARVNGIDISYETFGASTDPAILLVMGLGAQMLSWSEQMCRALADAGHFVIRYDNRDVGLSTHSDKPVPSLPAMLFHRDIPYEISDMADDGLGLLDHLGIDRFHLVGVSLGGFIAQTMAIAQPRRVITLSLLMTSTGSKRVGRPTPATLKRLAAQTPITTREAACDDAVNTYNVIGSPGHINEPEMRHLAGIAYDRDHDPNGRMRQLAAAVGQPNRTAALKKLDIPTVVIHGLADPLVTPSGGIALAKAIPNARFVGFHGMGHDLPHTMWRELNQEILALIDRTAAVAVAAGASHHSS